MRNAVGRRAQQQPHEGRRRSRQNSDRIARGKQCSKAWLKAIELATDILRRNGMSNENARVSVSEIQHVIRYLESLEESLNQVEQYWDQPPLKMPPRFRRFSPRNENNNRNNRATRNDSWTQVIPQDNQDAQEVLVMRRIQVRVVTAQSEVYAFRATQYRYERPFPRWLVGAETYGQSLERIHLALDLADSEYARLMLQEEDDNGHSNGRVSYTSSMSMLQLDADIVEVAVRYLTEERDKYKRSALQQAERLRRKLEPQWTSRDEVRERLGEDYWQNNPNPKNDHARNRREDEAQLRDIEAAIEHIETMDIPLSDTVSGRYRDTASGNASRSRGARQRYNGRRPTNLSRRVSLQDYPDPSFFEWKFTGSWNNYVEFFEKDVQDDAGNECLVKLDWYFTTGTVKTSLHHPTQGRTQLFGERVDPDVFVQILQNPRAHTSVRYQRRSSSRNSRPNDGELMAEHL